MRNNFKKPDIKRIISEYKTEEVRADILEKAVYCIIRDIVYIYKGEFDKFGRPIARIDNTPFIMPVTGGNTLPDEVIFICSPFEYSMDNDHRINSILSYIYDDVDKSIISTNTIRYIISEEYKFYSITPPTLYELVLASYCILEYCTLMVYDDRFDFLSYEGEGASDILMKEYFQDNVDCDDKLIVDIDWLKAAYYASKQLKKSQFTKLNCKSIDSVPDTNLTKISKEDVKNE